MEPKEEIISNASYRLLWANIGDFGGSRVDESEINHNWPKISRNGDNIWITTSVVFEVYINMSK